MDINSLDFSNLSAAQLAQLQNMLAQQKRDLQTIEQQRMGNLVRDFVETVVTESDPETSEKSAWVGWKVHGIPLDLDGTQVTVTVTITDVAAKAARDKAMKAAAARQEAEAAAAADDQATQDLMAALLAANPA